MAENCGGSCSSCNKTCSSRPLHETLHQASSVKKVIGVVSGKGGVGKSLVTSLMASRVHKDGFKAAILDADITGPSIPTAFGLGGVKAEAGTMPNKDGQETDYLKSVKTPSGLQMMSMNFLLPEETDPVIWRGPVISGAVKQFWTDVVWEDVDMMFVDCPPGTGDVPLTVFQSMPVDGIIIVASPQQLVRVIVEKACKMANTMGIPVLGLIENMNYVKCPDCDKEIKIFGESHIDEIAKDFNIPVLARIPIEYGMSSRIDNGEVESIDSPFLDNAVNTVEALLK